MPRCTEFHLWSKEWLWKKLFESHYRFGDIGVCQHLIRDVTFFPGIDDKGFIDRSELGDQQVKRVPQSLKGIVGRRNRDLQVVALGHSTSRKLQRRMDVGNRGNNGCFLIWLGEHLCSAFVVFRK